ncbi:hypothetical protein AWC22_21045 [Mycobacterium riyadhense]|uniref:Uncharacterized protein n=1 Tax=Mycobacterium riyadhense TaxID=486698 RepID=A0A1X2CLP6_9MYCO|nr:hypothetical protein [Mycobacterium riyadhense]ORW76850.1 hypothetical protein AWC22_21045 [Mycobacterium riyadhense]
MDAILPEESMRQRVTVLREDPPTGEEAQIDYGYLGSWTDGWAQAPGLGVRDGAGVVAVDVCAPGAEFGSASLDAMPCRGVSVLRRCPEAVGAG